jgi:hypothetical protein
MVVKLANGKVFFFFASMNVLSLIFALWMPETSKHSLEAMGEFDGLIATPISGLTLLQHSQTSSSEPPPFKNERLRSLPRLPGSPTLMEVPSVALSRPRELRSRRVLLTSTTRLERQEGYEGSEGEWDRVKYVDVIYARQGSVGLGKHVVKSTIARNSLSSHSLPNTSQTPTRPRNQS